MSNFSDLRRVNGAYFPSPSGVALIRSELFSPDLIARDGVTLLSLNIGKADCHLLFCYDQTFLIDSGHVHTCAALDAALKQCGVDRLDGVILTHCHCDHAGGLSWLADSGIAVGAWYASPYFINVTEQTHPALLAAEKRGEPFHWLRKGDVLPLANGARINVLAPFTRHTENQNNNSLVLFLTSPDGSILLCGDMKTLEENELIAAGTLEHAEIVKVSHHGDAQAASAAFLRAVAPVAAIISTSQAEDIETLEEKTLGRLLGAGTDVFVTQDAEDALLFSLRRHAVGAANVRWRGADERLRRLTMRYDAVRDALTLENAGWRAARITGALLYLAGASERRPLPVLNLAPGESVALDASCPALAGIPRFLSADAQDIAILYDALGRPLACVENGIIDD